jgi:hypothetical protein
MEFSPSPPSSPVKGEEVFGSPRVEIPIVSLVVQSPMQRLCVAVAPSREHRIEGTVLRIIQRRQFFYRMSFLEEVLYGHLSLFEAFVIR